MRTHSVLAVAAVFLAGCASASSSNVGSAAKTDFRPSVQTVNAPAAAAGSVRIVPGAPAPAQPQPAIGTTRTVTGSSVTHPAPAAPAPATSEQAAPGGPQPACPTNTRSGLPCVVR
jgi:hypothetical protein